MSETPTTTNRPLPIVLSLVACDMTIQDRVSGNHTLIGIFSDILATKFPALHPRMSIYAELTNGHGQSAIEVRLVDAATDDPVFSLKGPVDFPDPRMVARLNFNIANCVFKKAGEYRFQVWCEGNLLTERRIVVKQVEAQGEAAQ